MTVQEFLRAYFSLGSKFQSISVQKNEDGKFKNLYSSNDGYIEQYMNPQVRRAVVWKWGIDEKLKRIWITVEQ